MRTRRIHFALCLGVLLTSACTETRPEGAWTEVDSASARIVTLQPDLLPDTLRAEPLPGWESQPPFGDLVDVADGGGGRVVALDARAVVAWVFEAEGWVLERFGDAGVGPGEFYPGGLSSLVVRNDTAYIPDRRASQLVLYTLDGTFVDDVPLDAGPGVPTGWTEGPDGALLARTTGETPRIVRVARDGTVTDTVLELPSDTSGAAAPLAPTHLWCPLDDGRIAWATTDGYEVRIADPAAGEPAVTVVRGPWEPTPISDADADHLRSLLRQALLPRPGMTLPDSVVAALEGTPLPGRAPVLGGLLCGPHGRIWIQPAAPVSELGTDAVRGGGTSGWGGSVWHVVDLAARTVEVVRLPDGARVTRILDDLLLGIHVDGEGRETVGRWSLAR